MEEPHFEHFTEDNQVVVNDIGTIDGSPVDASKRVKIKLSVVKDISKRNWQIWLWVTAA